MNAPFLKQSLFFTLFLYCCTSINFRGVEQYTWVPNTIGILLCFVFLLNLNKIKLRSNYSLLILSILVLWNLISVFQNPEIFRYFITSFLILILAFIIYNISATYPEAIDYIKWAFIISMLIQIGISNTFIQYTDWGTIGRHRGTVGNANLYAFFLNIAFIFMLQKIGRPKNIIKYLLIFGVMSLIIFEALNTGSRKGIFVTTIVILFYFISSFTKISYINKIMYLFIGIYIAIQLSSYVIDTRYFYRFFDSFYYIETTTGDLLRYSLAQDGLRLFFEKPIFGWGGDGFRYFNNIEFTYSHINYLELLVNYGIIGFILFYSTYIWFFKKIYNSKYADENNLVISDKYIFLFILLVTLVLDMAMIRIFERMIWLIISMHLGKLFYQKNTKKGD